MATHRNIKTYDSGVRTKLKAHEEICAERYGLINGRLFRIEMIIYTTAGTSILSLLALCLRLLKVA